MKITYMLHTSRGVSKPTAAVLVNPETDSKSAFTLCGMHDIIELVHSVVWHAAAKCERALMYQPKGKLYRLLHEDYIYI